MQGNLPSHPKLLDFLAVYLVEQKWSMKSLHRLIVTSQTYQQSARRKVEVDKALLASFPRTRLEAEIIRDAALSASGLLNEKMYGPPVRPIQPKSAKSASYDNYEWKPSEGNERFRRSVYTYQKRTAPFAMFTTFDAGSGEVCLAKRDTSNTPLQALTLLNDPMFMEIADAYGRRIEAVEGNPSQKITAGFRWLLTRPPSDEELSMLVAFYQKHNDATALARVLLCLDETVNR